MTGHWEQLFCASLGRRFPHEQQHLVALAASLRTLGANDEMVLRLRFGLYTNPPLVQRGRQLSVREVAEIFGVTSSRIRQVEAKALRGMRRSERSVLSKDEEGRLAALRRAAWRKRVSSEDLLKFPATIEHHPN